MERRGHPCGGCEPVVTRTSLPGDPADTQSRYIEAAVNGVLIGTLYAPNGNPQPGPKFKYKLAWISGSGTIHRALRPRRTGRARRGLQGRADRRRHLSQLSRMPRTRLCSQSLEHCFGASSIGAGSTRSAPYILMGRSIPSGTTCEIAGNEMLDCASIICC